MPFSKVDMIFNRRVWHCKARFVVCRKQKNIPEMFLKDILDIVIAFIKYGNFFEDDALVTSLKKKNYNWRSWKFFSGSTIDE